MTSAVADKAEAMKTVHDLIKGIDIAMLTTIDEDGKGLISRPMKTQDVEFDGNLWFITKKDTSKFHELLHHKQVNVSYAGKSYVSIRGVAELVEDREKLEQFWNPVYEQMLEATPDDPNLILIKIHAETAEYWDTGNKLKMIGFLFNRLLGKDTEGSSMNQVVDLN